MVAYQRVSSPGLSFEPGPYEPRCSDQRDADMAGGFSLYGAGD